MGESVCVCDISTQPYLTVLLSCLIGACVSDCCVCQIVI